MGLSVGLLDTSSQHDMWLPPEMIREREQEGSFNTFYELVLEVKHLPHQILFIRSESLSLGHSQGEGN